MKISLITVTYNAGSFISDCIKSVLEQTYRDVEYIVVDGGSTDGTVEKIRSFGGGISSFISEKDNGIYDAMNKGIAMATGDVIGILNADDFFAKEDVLEKIAGAFQTTNADVVYGDLLYVDRNNTDKIIRKWLSKPYRRGLFQYGWMPAHPTFYARRELFEKYGNYDLSFQSAADYELMLRFVHLHQVEAVYLNKLLVKMRLGGVSNQSLINRLNAAKQDLRAMRQNGISFPLISIFLKPLRKLPQYL